MNFTKSTPRMSAVFFKKPTKRKNADWKEIAILEHWDLASKIAWRYTDRYLNRNREEYEDLMQTILLSWFELLDQFHKKCSLKAWLALIAMNISRTYTKSRNRWQKKMIAFNQQIFVYFLIDQEFTARQNKYILIEELLCSLDTKQQQILINQYIEGFSVLELAKQHGQAQSTFEIKTRKTRAEIQKNITEEDRPEFSQHERSIFHDPVREYDLRLQQQYLESEG